MLVGRLKGVRSASLWLFRSTSLQDLLSGLGHRILIFNLTEGSKRQLRGLGLLDRWCVRGAFGDCCSHVVFSLLIFVVCRLLTYLLLDVLLEHDDILIFCAGRVATLFSIRKCSAGRELPKGHMVLSTYPDSIWFCCILRDFNWLSVMIFFFN